MSIGMSYYVHIVWVNKWLEELVQNAMLHILIWGHGHMIRVEGQGHLIYLNDEFRYITMSKIIMLFFGFM